MLGVKLDITLVILETYIGYTFTEEDEKERQSSDATEEEFCVNSLKLKTKNEIMIYKNDIFRWKGHDRIDNENFLGCGNCQCCQKKIRKFIKLCNNCINLINIFSSSKNG